MAGSDIKPPKSWVRPSWFNLSSRNRARYGIKSERNYAGTLVAVPGKILVYSSFISTKRLYNTPDGAVAELADAADLKSAGGDTVRVRPPLAPQIWLIKRKPG